MFAQIAPSCVCHGVFFFHDVTPKKQHHEKTVFVYESSLVMIQTVFES